MVAHHADLTRPQATPETVLRARLAPVIPEPGLTRVLTEMLAAAAYMPAGANDVERGGFLVALADIAERAYEVADELPILCCSHPSDVHLPGGGCSECPLDQYEHDYEVAHE